MNDAKSTSTSPQLVLGAGIVILGCLLFLANLGFVHDRFIWKLWPLILVALGVSKLVPRREGKSPVGPVILIAIGVLLLLQNFNLGRLDDLIPPLLLIALGIFVVTRGLKRQRSVPDHLAASDDFLSGTAIFGGVSRRLASQDFQGGELTSIFGGFEADLSRAQLQGSARLDIFILFGGAELRIPEGWDVSVKATAALGGIEDKTYHRPAPVEGEAPRPRLVITGLVLFGGLEIKPA